jgi:hypothetical protein
VKDLNLRRQSRGIYSPLLSHLWAASYPDFRREIEVWDRPNSWMV